MFGKLALLGSFQAEYKATAPDKSGEITIIFNKERRYCLSRVTMGSRDKVDLYVVSDFTGINSEDHSFRILMLQGNAGKSFTISLGDLFRGMDNPLGVFSLMAAQLESGTEMHSLSPDFSRTVPSLTLGLSATDLRVALGASSCDSPLDVSWLNDDQLARVINVSESDHAVYLHYPDNRIVSVDKETGLLLKDSWPDPKRAGPREIVLQSHSRLDTNRDYASYIPSFKDIVIEELSPTHLYSEIYISFLTGLGRQLNQMENFDRILEEQSGKFTGWVRSAARKMIRDEVKKKVSTVETIKFMESFLRPSYERYTAEYPREAKNFTFVDFMDRLMITAETNPREIVPGGVDELIDAVQRECEAVVRELPRDARRPLKKIYDIAMPALVEGWILEFLSETITQAKALEKVRVK